MIHSAETLQRTAGSKLHISLQSIEEHVFVDIRIYMWNNETKDYVASKKGVTIPHHLLPEVTEILQNMKIDRKPKFLKEFGNETRRIHG